MMQLQMQRLASGSPDATELASSLNLSSKTLTMPQKFNGLHTHYNSNPTTNDCSKI